MRTRCRRGREPNRTAYQRSCDRREEESQRQPSDQGDHDEAPTEQRQRLSSHFVER